jgi:hypothetical protein
MVDATVEVVENADDAFDKAFTEAVTALKDDVKLPESDTTKADDTKVVNAPVVAAPGDKAAEEKAAKDAADAAATAALAAETPEDKAAREAAETKVATDAKIADDVKVVADAAAAVKAAADAKTAADIKAAADAAAVETPEKKKAREDFEASIKPYEPTEDEKAAMEEFKKEFPKEHAAVMAQFKSVNQDINARVYTAVQSVLQQVYKDIGPVKRASEAGALERHASAIYTAHKDYDAVIGLIPAWIKTVPEFDQARYQAAYDAGSTPEVIELVSRFKTATGRAADTGKAAADAAARVIADAAAAKAAEEAASLLPVTTKRTSTSPKGKADPNDFDGAWAEAVAIANAK